MSTPKAVNGMHAWLYIHPSAEQRRLHVITQIATDLDVNHDQALQHTNVVWVEPEGESLKRSEVTKVMSELGLTAFDGSKTRWVVIADAHRLTSEAANSLLKLIEEPPAATKIALLSPAASLVMATLRSRTGLVVIQAQFESEVGDQVQALEADRFLDASVSERFGIIGGAHKLKQANDLYSALMTGLYARRDFPALSWLQEYSQGRASRNARLILEAFAVREWLA